MSENPPEVLHIERVYEHRTPTGELACAFTSGFQEVGRTDGLLHVVPVQFPAAAVRLSVYDRTCYLTRQEAADLAEALRGVLVDA